MAKANALEAQFELGSRYNAGRDLPKNSLEALSWLRRAGESGHAGAQRMLALKLYGGNDVPVDLVESFKWTEKLANSGDPAGQLMLANLYANGEGTGRDLIRAYMWYDIAATPITDQVLDDNAARAQKSAQEARDKTRELLQPEEENEGQRLASNWWLQKYAPPPAKAAPQKKIAKPGKSKARAPKEAKE